MIKVISGDLLEAKEVLIVHQVNCMGVMDKGVAKQIREKWPEVYDGYSAMCKSYGNFRRELLGCVYWKCVGLNKYIGNLFGQYGCASDGKRHTDYVALREGLLKVRDFSEGGRVDIAMPYGIGCGNGGGDWDGKVFPMIQEIFDGFDVTLYKR